MNLEYGFDHRSDHQDGKNQEMQTNQGFRRTSQRSPLNTSRKL